MCMYTYLYIALYYYYKMWFKSFDLFHSKLCLNYSSIYNSNIKQIHTRTHTFYIDVHLYTELDRKYREHPLLIHG